MKTLYHFLFLCLMLTACTSKTSETQTSEKVDTVSVSPDPSVEIASTVQDYIEKLSASEGLTAVKSESGWGFINDQGTIVIPCQYSAVSVFTNGRAVVTAGDSQDWREAYQYIDVKGKSLGNFFVNLQGKVDCEKTSLVGTNESGERYASYNLSNCPDGTQTYQYQGWEWGNENVYYPNTTIKDVIETLANSQNEHAGIFKKFNGEPMEFKEGEYNVNFSVKKNEDNSYSEVSLSITSDSNGTNYLFSTDSNGALVRKDYGS